MDLVDGFPEVLDNKERLLQRLQTVSPLKMQKEIARALKWREASAISIASDYTHYSDFMITPVSIDTIPCINLFAGNRVK